MVNEELNKKLLKFAGFEYDTDMTYYFREAKDSGKYSYIEAGRQLGCWVKDGEAYRAAPNFTESLDACFKWLVPKLYKSGNQPLLLALSQTRYQCKVIDAFGRLDDVFAEAETPALALCLAIEKLVDAEAKNG